MRDTAVAHELLCSSPAGRGSRILGCGPGGVARQYVRYIELPGCTMSRFRPALLAGLLLCALLAAAWAQQIPRRPRITEAPVGPVFRGNIPTWPIDEHFKADLFTFARIK